jgi:hypothetical protein
MIPLEFVLAQARSEAATLRKNGVPVKGVGAGDCLSPRRFPGGFSWTNTTQRRGLLLPSDSGGCPPLGVRLLFQYD